MNSLNNPNIKKALCVMYMNMRTQGDLSARRVSVWGGGGEEGRVLGAL